MSEIVPPFALLPQTPIPQVSDVQVQLLSDGGGYRISWQMPAGLHGRRAQVYGRKVGARPAPRRLPVAESAASRPTLLGTGVGFIDVSGLDADLELRIVPELGEQGVFPGPQHAAAVRPIVPEFREIPNAATVEGFTADVDGSGILLQWRPCPGPDLTHYEVRRGTSWVGARVVARTTDTWVRYEYPPSGTLEFMVRAFYGPGIPSPDIATASTSFLTVGKGFITDARTNAYTVLDESPSLASGVTLSSDLEESGGVVTIKDGFYKGTITFESEDSGAYVPLRWSADWKTWQTEPGETLGCGRWQEMKIGDPEMQFALVQGRSGSWRNPAVDLDVLWSDLDQLGWCYVPGRGSGTLGESSRCTVAVQFNKDGSWSTAVPWKPSCTVGSAIRLIFTLERASLRQQVHFSNLSMTAYTVT